MEGQPAAVATDGAATSWRRAALCAGAYLVLWTASAVFLAMLPGGSILESGFILVALGIAFPALALAVTRGRPPGADAVAQPEREAAAALLYLGLFSVLVLGWGFSFLREQVPPGRSRELATLAVKLLTMCAGPALLFRALGSRAVAPDAVRLRPDDLWPGAILGVALFAFQAVVGRGLHELSALRAPATTLLWTAPAAFLWLYLRGGQLAEGLAGAPTVAWAIAYSIAVVSPAGLFFGVLWWRTRSLVLVVLLHAWMDLLPNLADFTRTWSG